MINQEKKKIALKMIVCFLKEKLKKSKMKLLDLRVEYLESGRVQYQKEKGK